MKIGRPKIETKERKSDIVAIRLKSNERKLLERIAKKESRKLSDWIRAAALDRASAN